MGIQNIIGTNLQDVLAFCEFTCTRLVAMTVRDGYVDVPLPVAYKEGFRRPHFGRVEFKLLSSTKIQYNSGSHFLRVFNIASNSILIKLT